VQIVGRGLRTSEGKKDLLILDHSDNHLRLGFVTDIHHEELDDGKPRKPRSRPREALPRKCPKCAYLKPPKTPVCPNCGFVSHRQNEIRNAHGVLVELPRVTAADASKEERERFYRELKHYCDWHEYKPGWAAFKFKEKFGVWPNGLDHLPPAQPSVATLSWIRSRQIAWAKSRKNERRQNA
jgi:hypothetical protein